MLRSNSCLATPKKNNDPYALFKGGNTMKKYPAIKFILITVVSGICGAVLSFLLSFQQAALVSAIQSLSRLLGSALPALHLSVCLFLSGMSVFSQASCADRLPAPTHKTRRNCLSRLKATITAPKFSPSTPFRSFSTSFSSGYPLSIKTRSTSSSVPLLPFSF